MEATREQENALTKILQLPEVTERVGYRRSAIYALIRIGKFPAPIALGARKRGWLADEIDEWVRARVAESRSAA
jgi:prophage regulatory protein